MNEILFIGATLALFCAGMFLGELIRLGWRFWRLCGTFASGHRIIDAQHASDKVLRQGLRVLDERGEL